MATKFEQLITALANPAQALETAFQQLLTLRSLLVATGQQLDDIGKIVGLFRNGLDDTTYRIYLLAQIATNRSHGKRSDLITIAKQILTGTDAVVNVDSQGAAAVVVRILTYATPPAIALVLFQFLSAAVAGGVRLILEYQTDVDAKMFTLAQATYATSALHIGDTTIPVGSTAGFPSSGEVTIDPGTTLEEQLPYTGITATSLIGVDPLDNNHVIDTLIEWTDSPGLGFARTTTTTAGSSIGDTALPVVTTSGYLSSGSLDLDAGLPTAETVTYTVTDLTHFAVSALQFNHLSGTLVGNASVNRGDGGVFESALS